MHLNVSAVMLNLSVLTVICFPNVYQNCFHKLLLNFCLQHYAKKPKLLVADCILKEYSLLSGA